jgi:hypothetical protein
MLIGLLEVSSLRREDFPPLSMPLGDSGAKVELNAPMIEPPTADGVGIVAGLSNRLTPLDLTVPACARTGGSVPTARAGSASFFSTGA